MLSSCCLCDHRYSQAVVVVNVYDYNTCNKANVGILINYLVFWCGENHCHFASVPVCVKYFFLENVNKE